MADLIITEELRTYLIAQGVGVAGAATPDPALPSIWTTPRDGALALREGEQSDITVSEGLASPAAAVEAWIIDTFVNIVVRARQERDAILLQRKILDLLHPRDSHGGRFKWTMNTLLVEYSKCWRGDQPLQEDRGSYVRVQSFVFGCRRKSLAGLPLLP